MNLSFERYKNDDSNPAVLLNDVILEGGSHETNGIDLIIVDSTLRDYNLKFHGKKNCGNFSSKFPSISRLVLENVLSPLQNTRKV